MAKKVMRKSRRVCRNNTTCPFCKATIAFYTDFDGSKKVAPAYTCAHVLGWEKGNNNINIVRFRGLK